jgi:hypothetical protein
MLFFVLANLVAWQGYYQDSPNQADSFQEADRSGKVERLARRIGSALQQSGRLINISESADNDLDADSVDLKDEKEVPKKPEKNKENSDKNEKSAEAIEDPKNHEDVAKIEEPQDHDDAVSNKSDESQKSDEASNEKKLAANEAELLIESPDKKKTDEICEKDAKEPSKKENVVSSDDDSKVVKTGMRKSPRMEDEAELPPVEEDIQATDAAYNTNDTIEAMQKDYSDERIAQLAYAVADSVGIKMTQVTVMR